MANYWYDPGFAQMAAAVAVAVLLAFSLSWAMDKLFMRRLVKDRIACIAYGCAILYLLMMGGATLFLTKTSPFVDGPIIIPPIGYAVSLLLGTGIAGALRMAIYSRYEGNLDEEIVFDPDYDDPSLYDHEVLAWDEQNEGRNYLRRHWAGHLSLPVSYWVNGVLVPALILAAAELIAYEAKASWQSLRAIATVALFYLIVSSLVSVWASVGIWRSAYWHRRRGGAAGWGFAARALIVLSGVVALFRSGDFALQAAELGGLATGRDSLGTVAAMTVSPDGHSLSIRGTLSEGAADRFDKLLAASPNVTQLLLSSRGGRMFEAERIAAAARKRGLDTQVDDFCMSACTSILLAGRVRTADEKARIGFHQPAFPGLSSTELRGAIEQTRQEYLAAGVDEGFAWRAMTTPAESIWVPAPEELLSARVLTQVEVPVWNGTGSAQSVWIVRSGNDLAQYHALKASAARINASAPIRLGPLVSLDRAAVSGTDFTQYYTIRLPRLSAADKAKLTELSRRDTCSDPAMLQAFRAGVGMVNVYRDPAGRAMLRVDVSDCPHG